MVLSFEFISLLNFSKAYEGLQDFHQLKNLEKMYRFSNPASGSYATMYDTQ